MNKKDTAFRDLNGTLQVRYRSLHESGVGAVVKHAVVVLSEEDTLWPSKVALALIHVAVNLAAAPLHASRIAQPK